MILRPPSLRSAIALASIVAILPLLILSLVHAGTIRRHIAQQQSADANALAEQTAAGLGRDLEGTRKLLTAVAHYQTVRTMQVAETSAILRELLTTSPLFANLILIDERGDIVASAQPKPVAVNVADRPYFRRMQANRHVGLGEYMVGRVTGRASIPVAYPIPASEPSAPLRSLLASIDLEALERSLESYPLHPGTQMVLLDRNGTILAQRGNRFGETGKRFPDWVGLPRAHALGATALNGKYHTLHFAQVPGADEGITVGIARLESALTRAAQVAFATNLGLASLVIAFAIMASWWIADRLVLHPTRKISNAAAALAEGHWAARAQVDAGAIELKALGETFDRLAQHLQRQLAPPPTEPLTQPDPKPEPALSGDANQLQQALATQQAADDALRRSEATSRAFLSSMPESALLLDPAGRILIANPTAAERLQCPVARLVGSNIAEHMPPDLFDERRAHLVAVIQTRQPLAFDDSRDNRSLHTQLTPVLDAHGEVAAIAVLSFDITERQNMENRLRDSIADLQKALADVNTLSGLLPICAGCKRIRDDGGYWNNVEQYLREHTRAEFSHGLCPDCMRRLYPEFADEIISEVASEADKPPPPA